jgi:short-subunit dehydrogenase
MEQGLKTSPVILVTGASSGIGAAAAKLFAKQGYAVVLAARRRERLDKLAAEIVAEGGEALAVTTDVSRLDDVRNCVALTLDRFNRLDVLFNNAGFGHMNWLEMQDPFSDIEAQIKVNLLGAIYMAQAATPIMINQGKGHIINIASVAGLVGMPTYSIYAATKFGMRGFNEALRRELHPWGIHVSIIFPGGAETEFSQHTGVKRKTGFSTPPGIRLSADDVAKAAYHLTKHPRRQMIMPWFMTGIVWFNALFPGIFDGLVESRFVRREREIKTSTFHNKK